MPWVDLDAFTERVWQMRNDQFDGAVLKKINFYDRTNVDAFAYLNKGQLALKDHWEADLKAQRFEKVFILPVWPEIHSLDSERTETLEECIEVEAYLREAYTSLGYELIEVPKMSVEERVAFIERHL